MATKQSLVDTTIRKITPGNHSALTFWTSILIFSFILAPLVVVIGVSFSSQSYIAFPPESLSLQWYEEILTDSDWLSPMRNSVMVGGLVAVFSTICGTCGAIALNKGDFPFRTGMYTLLIAPMMVPQIILAIAIYNIFLTAGLTGSILSISLALTPITIPYPTITVMASFNSLDHSTTDAARIHGATRLQTFLYVTLPAILPGVISGAVFSFIMAWNDYIIAVYVSGGIEVLPITIFDSLQYQVNPTIAAVGSIIIGVSFLMTILVFIFDERY